MSLLLLNVIDIMLKGTGPFLGNGGQRARYLYILFNDNSLILYLSWKLLFVQKKILHLANSIISCHVRKSIVASYYSRKNFNFNLANSFFSFILSYVSKLLTKLTFYYIILTFFWGASCKSPNFILSFLIEIVKKTDYLL